MRTVPAVSAAAALLLAGMVAGAPVASASNGSDGETPYEVTAEGLTLPQGSTFTDGGHVNVRFTADGAAGSANIHFESQNGQASGAYIGESYLPWSELIDAEAYCVTWVQVGGFDEHFGEGGQEPVCTQGEEPGEPTPSPSVPAPEPSASEEGPTPVPSTEGEPSPEPSGEPEPSGSAPAEAAPTPTPSGSAAAEAPEGELAATGATVGAAALLAVLLAAGGAAIVLLSRRAKQN